MADLWGGWQDPGAQRPWQADTLVNVFSVGEGWCAIAVARLVSDGLLSYDEPVARVWPEFGAHGKSGVTVRQLLSHQAGLPAIRAILPAGAMFDWTTMCETLAAHEPWWDPGTAHGYHVNTFGFLVGEIVRRVSGQTIGRYVREQIATPLAADFFIGLKANELDRVAHFVGMDVTPEMPLEGTPDEGQMERHAYFNPPEFSGPGVVNSTAWRQAELPSTNGHASARGIARLYEALLHPVQGEALAAPGVLEDATTEQVYGDDLVLHRPSRFGIGFQLTQDERRLGPNQGAFGHFGAGGSLGFCDPQAELAFGYATNTLGPGWQNPRNRALIDACYECLA